MSMNFARFQDTRKYYADLADCKALAEYEISGPGFTYMNESLWIGIGWNGSSRGDGRFWTIIVASDVESRSLENVELELFEWAASEGMF